MFTIETIRFLRALKRNNDRHWFKARKDRYEEFVRAPMLELIERLARDLPSFAPDIVASPRASLYRIYRDTRFSSDKSPLKTHIGAIFPRRGMARHECAGFYLEIAPRHTFIGGGLYAPQPPQLRAVRRHIAANPERWIATVEGASFRRAFGDLQGDKLTRVPPGFSPDNRAAEYLKYRQFLVGVEHDAEFATAPSFYREVLRLFKRMAPLVAFLNEPAPETGPTPRTAGSMAVAPGPKRPRSTTLVGFDFGG